MAELAVKRKTDNSWMITFKRNNVAIDITGYTIFFTVKKNTSQSDTDAIITKTILPGQLTDPTHGITRLTLTDTDTDIAKGSYVYDLIFIDGSGNRKGADNDTFIVKDYVRHGGI